MSFLGHQDPLTHWGRVTHICVGNLTLIGPDNGLLPGGRQAIIWTNAGILWIGPLGTNVSEILIKILTFSFKKMRLKVSSAKWRPFCLGLNVLNFSTHSPQTQQNCICRKQANSIVVYGILFELLYIKHFFILTSYNLLIMNKSTMSNIGSQPQHAQT